MDRIINNNKNNNKKNNINEVTKRAGHRQAFFFVYFEMPFKDDDDIYRPLLVSNHHWRAYSIIMRNGKDFLIYIFFKKLENVRPMSTDHVKKTIKLYNVK